MRRKDDEPSKNRALLTLAVLAPALLALSACDANPARQANIETILVHPDNTWFLTIYAQDNIPQDQIPLAVATALQNGSFVNKDEKPNCAWAIADQLQHSWDKTTGSPIPQECNPRHKKVSSAVLGREIRTKLENLA